MADAQNNPAPAQSFPDEFAQCWRQLPNKTFFFVLLAAWALLFQFLGNATLGYINTPSIFVWMYEAYNAGDGADAHGLLIPLVVLVMFWWKRKELLAVKHRVWPPALLLLLVALGLHAISYLVQQPKISIVALFVGLYALTGLAWGPGWLKASVFPFFLFVFSLPLSAVVEPISFPLRVLVSQLVTSLSPILGIDVLREGTQLYNAGKTYQYEVAAACSGIRSLVAITCIATIYGFVSFEKNWKRLLLIAAAIPLAVLSNVIRMFCIIIAAELSGQASGNYVHESSFFSLVPYVPAILGVILLGHWLRERPEPQTLPLKPRTA